MTAQSIVIRKEKRLLARLPVHCISGIVLFGANTLSTACCNVAPRAYSGSFCSPAGLYVNTLKPDSRNFFHLLAEHSNQHAALSATEQVKIATGLVTLK
nr:CRISPR-associated endonuclease Cas1 [Candidatus Electrothrix aestuarii]